MNLNNFTIKSQEAVQQAVQLATQNGQQAIEAVHLLKGVIMTGESVTNFIFGADYFGLVHGKEHCFSNSERCRYDGE